MLHFCISVNLPCTGVSCTFISSKLQLYNARRVALQDMSTLAKQQVCAQGFHLGGPWHLACPQCVHYPAGDWPCPGTSRLPLCLGPAQQHTSGKSPLPFVHLLVSIRCCLDTWSCYHKTHSAATFPSCLTATLCWSFATSSENNFIACL